MGSYKKVFFAFLFLAAVSTNRVTFSMYELITALEKVDTRFQEHDLLLLEEYIKQQEKARKRQEKRRIQKLKRLEKKLPGIAARYLKKISKVETDTAEVKKLQAFVNSLEEKAEKHDI